MFSKEHSMIPDMPISRYSKELQSSVGALESRNDKKRTLLLYSKCIVTKIKVFETTLKRRVLDCSRE